MNNQSNQRCNKHSDHWVMTQWYFSWAKYECVTIHFPTADCNLQMGLKSGMVIGVPIPESHAPLGTQIEAAIQQALQDAKYVSFWTRCSLWKLTHFCALISISIPASHISLPGFRNKGISGKEVTPFVLQRVNQLTKGKSLEASILLSTRTLWN